MAVVLDVQAQLDSFTARLEAQEREIGNLKARGRRKQANAPADARPRSRRDLLKLGGAAGAASLAAIAGLGRTQTAEATYTITGGQVNTADHETTLAAQASYPDFSMLILDANVNGNSGSIFGLRSKGAGIGIGVYGQGGLLGGIGVLGQGGGSNAGVHGTGSGNGNGVTGAGAGLGTGVSGTGGGGGGAGVQGLGTAGGDGVQGVGDGAGPGVSGVGGGSNGDGVIGTGGLPGGRGVRGLGTGSGEGVRGDGGSSGGSGVLGYAYSAGGLGAQFYGLRAQLSLVPAPSTGTPAQQNYTGDIWVDSTGTVFVCIATGNPGTWVAVQTGGSTDATKNNFFRSVITTQPTLLSSNGSTWTDMSGGPTLSITPRFNCVAVLSANADLWTDTAGFNQDIGIAVSGGAYPSSAGQPEVWKESGGFAGTFSPNAAFVQTAIPLVAGTPYGIKLQWKTNKNAPGATIRAGAGPIGGKFSPTSLAAHLIVAP